MLPQVGDSADERFVNPLLRGIPFIWSGTQRSCGMEKWKPARAIAANVFAIEVFRDFFCRRTSKGIGVGIVAIYYK